MSIREMLFDLPCCLNEINSIAIMLFDTGRDREDIGIDNNILGQEA